MFEADHLKGSHIAECARLWRPGGAKATTSESKSGTKTEAKADWVKPVATKTKIRFTLPCCGTGSMIPAKRCAMRTTVALAVFLMFAVSVSGQAVERPQAPQQQSPILRPRARVVPIPNWPANKPAPVIPIPTQMNPQSNLTNRGLHPMVPLIPSRPRITPRITKTDGATKVSAAAAKPAP